ncbi:hypothetical protein WMF39_12325 [Sorangium sp. So ce1504]|uniref:hypothetical protein n=1 Tax=Sorangium sp. So ce1504 TaxID=3133337 RepID=UPI003F5FC9AF
MRLSRLALSLLWFPVALSATTFGCVIDRVPIGDLDPGQQPLDPDGSGAGGAGGAGGSSGSGGAGGSSGRCSAAVASRPFSLDDWPATSGTFPLAITDIAFDPSGNLGMTGYTTSDVDMGGGVLRSGGTDDALLATYDAAGNHTLSKLFGDDSNPQAGEHIVFDADCNMFLVGSFSQTMDLEGATMTSPRAAKFLAKLDSAGNPLWSVHLNAAYDTDWDIRSIAVDPTTGGVVFTGNFAEFLDLGGGPLTAPTDAAEDPTKAYVAKFDATGHFVWSKYADGRYMPGGTLAVDASGQIVIATDDSYLDDGQTRYTRLGLSRLDASGNRLWRKEFAAPFEGGAPWGYHRSLTGVAVDGDGSVFLAGNAQCDFDFGGGPLHGTDCSNDSPFVAKFDADGAHLWSQVIRGDFPFAVSFGVDALGNTFVSGSVGSGGLEADGMPGGPDGDSRPFVMRFDSEGHISWVQILGSEVIDVLGLAVDPEGNVAVVGQDVDAVNAPFGAGNVVMKLNVAAP